MKNILTVMRKEFARFFKDRRMIITTLLPAIMIYVLYSFMGTAMTSMFSPEEVSNPWISAVNMPESISPLLTSSGISIANIKADEVEGVKEKIVQKETDICIIFPQDFDAQVAAYDVQTVSVPAPDIEIYYNSTAPNSADIYNRVSGILDVYEASLANKFDVNQGVATADLATAEDVSAGIISMLMPMLLMIFLFSGCMGLALESITGEKERGTIATLLVTPLKRSE
jgi:sodium transport system permease protein